MNEIEKRIGKLTISRELLVNNPDIAMLIMSKLIIIRCEFLYYMDAFEYIAMSPYFELNPYPELNDTVNLLPEYIAIVTNELDFSNNIKFEQR